MGGHAATYDCRHASRVRTPTAAVVDVDPTQHRLAAFHGSALFLSCRHTLSANTHHLLSAIPGVVWGIHKNIGYLNFPPDYTKKKTRNFDECRHASDCA